MSMTVMIRTDTPKLVIRRLTAMKLAPMKESTSNDQMIITYSSDADFRELTWFISFAIGCGMITGFDIINDTGRSGARDLAPTS